MTGSIEATVIGLCVARMGVFAWLHVRHREFSVLRNTVSDYATGPVRPYTVMGALSLLAYALTLFVLVREQARPSWALAVLGIGLVGSLAIVFVPTDLTGTARTPRGIAHWALAVVNFAALFVFMTNIEAPGFAAQPAALVAATWVVRVTFYAFLVTLVVPGLRRAVMGLTERLYLTATPVWFIVLAACLMG